MKMKEISRVQDKKPVVKYPSKFHPHGDTSIYDAIVRIAQDFQLNIPLIDGHGNFGNIDGDSAAAMRYTEARLSKISNELIDGLKDKIVDFVPNFDETELEPEVLPGRFPQLLTNGATGIAVGLTSNIPTHNLREVSDMIVNFIKKDPIKEDRLKGKKNPMNNQKLLDILKGPDFPTGGAIVNEKDLLNIYTTGEGKILIRGKLALETINGKSALIIKEIPYTYSGRKSSLIEKISDLVLNKKLEEITEIRDESTEDIRVVLELKKGVNVEKVKNKLYKFTPLQDTFGVRMVALNGREILTFSLYEYCRIFTDFQRDIYTKEYSIKRAKLLKKKEIYEGLKIAYDYIDVIIDLIRHSPKIDIAEKCLRTGETKGIKFALKKNEQIAKKFKFTALQSESILATTLRKLNALEITFIEDNLKETQNELSKVEKILNDEKELNKVIINRILKISKEFGRDRRTVIKNAEIKEYVEEKKIKDIYLIYDKYGYIKCFDELTYAKLDESVFENCQLNLKTTNQDNLWCFSSNGKLYQIKGETLSYDKIKDRGVVIENKIKKDVEGDILYVCTENTIDKLLFVTKKGLIKIVDKEEFKTIRSITQATKLSKDDEILTIIPVNKNDKRNILINTDDFYLIFSLKEVSEQKKTAIGISSIKTDKEIIEAQIIEKGQTEIHINKQKFKISDLKIQKRANKGTKI